MFVIRKVGQRKTLSDQQKTLSSQFQSKKNLTWFSGKCFPLVVFVFRKVVSGKSLSKLSCVCLPLGKLINGKHFPKVVKSLEMSLFADYIKFDPQTFDYYIYFVLNIYFLISSLKILFLY